MCGCDYLLVGAVIAVLWCLIFVVGPIIWYGLLKSWKYINDDRQRITDRYFVETLYMRAIRKLNPITENTATNFDGWTGGAAYNFLIGIGICLAWPAAIISGSYYLLLRFLRVLMRMKKTIFKLARYVHTHPKSVETNSVNVKLPEL